jgi:ferredoxin-fold anticodon binding domain-containing protein
MPECISELEILFYGKNIAQYEVTTSNSIAITNIKDREPDYLFVTNTKDVAAPKFSFKTIIKLLLHKYSLRKRREKSAERKSFDASDMLSYHARSFC